MVSILSKDDYLNNFIIESYSNSDAKNISGLILMLFGLKVQKH